MPIKNSTTTASLNSDMSLDFQRLIESPLLVQANSGGGKSWLLRRLLEQSQGKVQQIILDPEGEFGTLRERYNYVLAGKGGDTLAESRRRIGNPVRPGPAGRRGLEAAMPP